MAKSHILVVEDDKSLADVLAYNLAQAGFEVSVARDGQDGLQQAEVKVPDLVLLDLMLPEMDGLTVCRRLRANAVTRESIIVMLTAKSEEYFWACPKTWTELKAPDASQPALLPGICRA